MSYPKKQFNSIDEYIGSFPVKIQVMLENIRQTIKETAHEAEETISYQIPTFKLKRNLVHFAAYKNHIGFYPTPSAIESFKKELINYDTTKGTIKFPINKPIPIDLVRKIVKFRVEENLGKK